MRARRWLWMVAAGGLSFLAASLADAATVQGTLVFASGRAATYVAVRLNSPTRGLSELSYSGSDGKFYMKNIPEGNYQLEVLRGGKVVTSVPITVHEPSVALPPVRVP